MSLNIRTDEVSLCDSCVHMKRQDRSVVVCQLLHSVLLEGKTACEDWEEMSTQESQAFECD